MTRALADTPGFTRALRRFLRRHPHAAQDVRMTLRLLAEDAYAPQLGTHKLKGELTGSWACSAGYDARIVFEFAKVCGQDVIVLHNVGTHDEVY